MPASWPTSRWIVALAGACAVGGLLLKLADLGESEAPSAGAIAEHPSGPPSAHGTKVTRSSPEQDEPRIAAPEPSDTPAADSQVARAQGSHGSEGFPSVLGSGFAPSRPSSAQARRAQRKAERKKAREARRQARLQVARTGGEPGDQPGTPDSPSPGAGEPAAPGTPPGATPPTSEPAPAATGVVFQSDTDVQYLTDTPIDIPDLAQLAGQRGSLSFWLQPQWQDGNQDDASFIDIGDGRLQVIKNVNFLRFEVVDDAGVSHGVGAPISAWKTGEWHQVASSWNGNLLQLYFDGALVSQTTIGSEFNLPDDIGMTIGSNFPASRPIAAGLMGGVDVHNRPLAPNEVLSLYRAGAGR